MGSILIYTLPITFLLLSTVGVLQSLDVKDIYDSIKDIDSSSFDGVTPHMSRRLRAISANSKLTASKWLSGRPSKWLCESAPTTLTENLPVIVVNQTRSRALRGATRRFQRTKKEALVGRDVSEGDSGNLGKDYLKLLPRLLLDISAYVQVSDITIITPGLNQDLCQALAIKILREGRFGRCLSFEDLEGYVDVLVLLSEDEASDGDGVSRLLRAVISKEDDGKLEAGHVVVVLGHLGEVSAPRTSVTQYLVVKFQENHTFEFTEYFTFGNSRPASSVVGFWTREKPWIPVRGDIVAPHDFEGNVIRAAITHSEPYIIIRKDDRGRTLSVEGYLVDLWRVLEDELNFTTQWLVPQDEEFGTPLPNGSWSGMVGLLKNGRADVALGPLSVTIPRSYVMDFSPAIDYHVLRLLILRGTSHDALDWGTYILAFHWLVWLSVIGLWVAMSVGLVFVAQPDAEITIQNYLFIFLGALAQQGSEVIPSCTRGRVVFYMYWIGSLLLYTSYTARLTSQLAVVNTNTPFDSLRDAMTKAHYKIATMKGTSYVSELQATTDPALAMAYAQMEEDPRLFVATMEAGVELAGTERVAFFQDVNSVSYITHGNCSFQWLGPEYFPSYVHLGYRKNLSYANALTYYVTMTATTGIIPKLMKKWWGATSTCSATTPFQNLSFSKTVSAFALLAVGLGAGLSLLMIEVLLNCVYRAFQKRKKVNRWMQHRKTFYY